MNESAPKLSTVDRVVSSVKYPKSEPLAHNVLFNPDKTINLPKLQEHFFHEGRLFHDDVIEIVKMAADILEKEPTLVCVEAPITGLHKYSEEIYDFITESFNALPLAALMNGKFLCIHGGLSPDIKTLLSVIRAHEAQNAGYKMHLQNDATGFPSVITLFSAPNYLDAYNNKGAVLRYENNVMNIRQFNCSPHPYWLPNFMDVFTWSMPFVSEKVAEMLLVLLNLCDDEEAEKKEAETKDVDVEAEQRKQMLRAKVRSVSKMMRMFSILRQERETIMMIKSFTPARKIPQGLLSEGKDALKRALGDFAKARKMDLVNEKRPPLIDRVNSRGELLRMNSRGELFRINSKGDLFRSTSFADLKVPQGPQETIQITAPPKE
eukprot:gene10589-12321_t